MGWAVQSVSVHGPEARAELLVYYTEIVCRYHDRPATDEEVASTMADDSGGDLTAPAGRFPFARHGQQADSCAGSRLKAPEVAELTRVFVRPTHRGTGGGAALVAAVERAARTRRHGGPAGHAEGPVRSQGAVRAARLPRDPRV